MFRGFGMVLLLAMFWVIGIAIAVALRNYGVSSCEARGGIAVTRSWINPSMWDVSCIHVK